MRIAAVSDDGQTISAHFGRAQLYVVYTVADGAITGREVRAKLGHRDFASTEHDHSHEHEHNHAHEHEQGHGFDAGAQSRHAQMFAAILDCDVVLARGMGAGAYQGLSAAGIRPIVTTVASIDAAVSAYIAGQLTDHPEKLH